jgi:hypothetical protein
MRCLIFGIILFILMAVAVIVTVVYFDSQEENPITLASMIFSLFNYLVFGATVSISK